MVTPNATEVEVASQTGMDLDEAMSRTQICSGNVVRIYGRKRAAALQLKVKYSLYEEIKKSETSVCIYTKQKLGARKAGSTSGHNAQ